MLGSYSFDARYKNFPRPLTLDDEFYRAIHPDHLKDGKISPAAFLNPTRPFPTNRMSVDWAEKSSPQQTFDRWKAKWVGGHGVASITAQLCWDNEQVVEYTPDTESGNPAHSDVVGDKDKQGRIRKNLAQGARLVIPDKQGTRQ